MKDVAATWGNMCLRRAG